ncbi:hypothetical protein [Telmatospirillum sp. J64-1]|uniref:hypothetical protein n=1 Tax=Telmatospirillum sp. J64-1 TaxID=2502183 RepID=UPI00115D41A3|nr:hypothetical protein [Telmatospirillum sp. J64-1]
MRLSRLALPLLLAALIPACQPSKADLISKSDAVTTKAQLRQSLGEPDGIDKFGPLERWIYDARDGRLVFVIAGDTITLQHTE